VGCEKLFHFCKSDVSAVQGHQTSLILAPIESAYASSYPIIPISNSNLGAILHRFGDFAAFMCS